MKSLGFHLCSWRKSGCLCPCPGPRRALGGRKDRQSCTFTPSRHKSIKTCCITAPLTFTRVTSAKSWQQISASGETACVPQIRDRSFSFLGNQSATEPVPTTGNTAHTKACSEAWGRNPLPARAGAADPVYHKGKQCFVSANLPPFRRQGH